MFHQLVLGLLSFLKERVIRAIKEGYERVSKVFEKEGNDTEKDNKESRE